MKPKNNESNATGTNTMPSKDYLAEKCQIFGENMRIARKERGFTSEALGRFLGISTAYVGLIERGERCPSLETFLKICDFFGESYEAMLTSKSTLSVRERKAGGRNGEKNQVERKQKMISGMISTFNAEELDHIIGVIKSFKNFTHKRGTEAAEELSFSSDDVRDLG